MCQDLLAARKRQGIDPREAKWQGTIFGWVPFGFRLLGNPSLTLSLGALCCFDHPETLTFKAWGDP